MATKVSLMLAVFVLLVITTQAAPPIYNGLTELQKLSIAEDKQEVMNNSTAQGKISPAAGTTKPSCSTKVEHISNNIRDIAIITTKVCKIPSSGRAKRCGFASVRIIDVVPDPAPTTSVISVKICWTGKPRHCK